MIPEYQKIGKNILQINSFTLIRTTSI